MADIDLPANDAAMQIEPPPTADTFVDEDLIDYDSDDFSVKDPNPRPIQGSSDAHALGLGETLTDADPGLDEPESMKKSEEAASPSAATGLDGSDQVSREIDAPKEQEYDILDEDGSAAGAGHATTTAEHGRGSIHEIDYEDDDFSYEPAHHNSQPPPTRSLQSPAASRPPEPESADVKEPAERYEIDWEHDEESVIDDGPDAASRGLTGAEATAHAEIDEQASDTMDEKIDLDDQGSKSEELVAAQQASQWEEFPAITVQYKGEEFPFFSLTSNGFFSEVSILDETMKAVLDGFRTELVDEIGPQDELVFQVDKLGLEFSESSPRDTLSVINMRQILEVLDILVKNQDPDSSRTLYTYLFTRPNPMKRFEYLVECATGDKGLAEVVHMFQPPYTEGVPEVASASNGGEEPMDGYQGFAGDDATNGHEDQGGLADEDADCGDDTYAYDDERTHDESELVQDEDTIDYEEIAPAEGDDGQVEGLEDAGEEAANGSGGPGEFGAGDGVDASHENQFGACSGPFDSKSTAGAQDEDLIDFMTGDEGTESANVGAGRSSDAHHDADAAAYSITGGQDAIHDDGLLGDVSSADNRNTADHDNALDYDGGDKETIADDGGIDGDGAGNKLDSLQQEAQHENFGEDQVGGAAYVYDNQHDDDLIDYSTDDKFVPATGIVRHDEGNNAIDDPDAATGDAATKFEPGDEIYDLVEGGHVDAGDQVGGEEGPRLTGHGESVAVNDADEEAVADPLHGPGESHAQTAAGDEHSVSAAAADDGIAAQAESALEPIIDVHLGGPGEAGDVGWTADAHLAEGGPEGDADTGGTAGSTTASSLRNNGHATSTPGDVAAGLNPPGWQEEPAEIDWEDDAMTGMDDDGPPHKVMKRAHPAELEGDEGNDVKRRRS